ncbi:response regulator [Desulfobacterales bacterium HSG17]|nr:response regulator [Desulfobacterales bacterium HSG17]
MNLSNEKKVLVVDDEPDIRNFLSACLEDNGFQIETAKDGKDALAKIDDFEPDLMTLDMVMPGMSGVKVIRKLRKTEKWAKLPIIVITAHAHDELGEEDIKGFHAMTSGLRPKITMEKPISPPNLIKVICDILECEPSSETASYAGNEKDQIKNLLDNADEETLTKIKNLLNS